MPYNPNRVEAQREKGFVWDARTPKNGLQNETMQNETNEMGTIHTTRTHRLESPSAKFYRINSFALDFKPGGSRLLGAVPMCSPTGGNGSMN